MVEILKNNYIRLTRGDSARIKIDLIDDSGEEYIPSRGDVLRFAMKKKYEDEECIIKKVISNDDLLLRITPSDTKNLPQPGMYVYDIEITFANGEVYTVVSSAIELTEEVD